MTKPNPSQRNSPPEAASAVAADALARRRVLLKGLGKGSAVVAAVAVPIQTLAAGNPLARLCTVSGVQSNVGSGRPGGTTDQCRGYTLNHFATLANWPGYTAGAGGGAGTVSFFVSGAGAYSNSTGFSTVFGGGSGMSLFDVITLSTASPSEKIWVAAVLSAVKMEGLMKGPSAFGTGEYFPYTPGEVVALYSSTRKVQAEAFFASYLQNLP